MILDEVWKRFQCSYEAYHKPKEYLGFKMHSSIWGIHLGFHLHDSKCLVLFVNKGCGRKCSISKRVNRVSIDQNSFMTLIRGFIFVLLFCFQSVMGWVCKQIHLYRNMAHTIFIQMLLLDDYMNLVNEYLICWEFEHLFLVSWDIYEA